jgi:hypothetical protein
MDNLENTDIPGDEEKKDLESETDKRLKAKLKELIELNELQAGALKKIINKLRDQRDPEDQS